MHRHTARARIPIHPSVYLLICLSNYVVLSRSIHLGLYVQIFACMNCKQTYTRMHTEVHTHTDSYLHIASLNIYVLREGTTLYLYLCTCTCTGTCACICVVCICLYIYTPTLTYVCYVCVYVCMHACLPACLPACMHACMHACIYVCMYLCNVM